MHLAAIQPSQVRFLEIAIAVIIILTNALIQLGKWIERQTQAAEMREWKRTWYEDETVQQVIHQSNDWPLEHQASLHFFGTPDPPKYNIYNDAVEYMAFQDAETQAFIKKLHDEH